MKAIVQDQYGREDDLQLKEIDQPVIAAGDVLVRVRGTVVITMAQTPARTAAPTGTVGAGAPLPRSGVA